MNATPRVLPAFIPDAGAAAAAPVGNSTPPKTDGGPSFASSLKEVAAKAGRRPVTSKAAGGESLPSSGNASPAAPLAAVPQAALPQAAALLGTAATSSPGDAPAEAWEDPPSATAVALSVAQARVDSAAAAAAAAASRPTAAAVSTAAPAPGTAFPGVASGGRVVSPLPVGVAGAAADSPDTDLAPQQAPAAASAAPGPAISMTGGTGKAPGLGVSSRFSSKTTLQHSGAALNAPDDSGGDDADPVVAGTSSTSSVAARVAAAAADASSSAPSSSDTMAAAALATLAGSRTADSAAASAAASDSGAATVSAAAVAGASLTDASLQASATAATADAATAPVAQATALAGLARSDKHTFVTLDTSISSGGADAAAGSLQLSSNAGSAPVEATATPTLRVAATVDSANFPQDLSARVSWMVDNNINGAKLQVNPPQLGPIELRILVSGDHAQVWMSTHSAVTRDALESSTPTLREMLGTQGFSQVSVDISQRSFQERSSYSQPYEQASTTSGNGKGAPTAVTASATPRNSLGALDAYA